MNKKIYTKMKLILMAEKEKLLKTASTSEDIDADGDETDEIQAKMIFEVASALNFRNAAKLRQINAALKKIDDRTYGLCEECGEDISEKRLSFNPCFKTCIVCAEAQELEEKQTRRRAI